MSTTWTTRPDTVEAQVVSSHTYVLNDLNQRTKATLEDGSYWVYDYDAKGQLIAGKHYLANDSPIAGQQFEYDYDDIGNRTAVRTGGDAEGDNLRTHTYAADLLNLYQQRAGALNTADIMGSAPVDTPVQVNGQTATRQGEYFHAEVSADTSAASRLDPVLVAAVRPAAGPNGEDLVATDGGAVFLPQTPEIYLYDADGNLVRDSRWTYTWDAEDRLIEMVEHPDIVGQSARHRLVFAYDYTARRRAKSVYEWDANTESWTLTRHTAFAYDGWNLLAELEPVSLTATPLVLDVANRHTWGLDLSGTLQGVGGIGGLLLSSDTNTFPVFDDGGSIVASISAHDGSSGASYTYSPYGNMLCETGSIGSRNPFRFSTKYQDLETGLLYFGYRYYQPQTGRWISRDPVSEEGGLGLYSFISNDPTNSVDRLGLERVDKLKLLADRAKAVSKSHRDGRWVSLIGQRTPPGTMRYQEGTISSVDGIKIHVIYIWEYRVFSRVSYTIQPRNHMKLRHVELYDEWVVHSKYVLLEGDGAQTAMQVERLKSALKEQVRHRNIDEFFAYDTAEGQTQLFYMIPFFGCMDQWSQGNGGIGLRYLSLDIFNIGLVALGANGVLARIRGLTAADDVIAQSVTRAAGAEVESNAMRITVDSSASSGAPRTATRIEPVTNSGPAQPMLPGMERYSGSPNLLLPEYTGGKTSGLLHTEAGSVFLESGYKGPSSAMPRGTPGMNGRIKAHVEAHAASVMRQNGIREAVLDINRIPCPGNTGCDAMLPRMLPEGSRFPVRGPDGYVRTYTGAAD